jgi:hypothetical protein
MPSATPIYDALAEQMLGPLADFVPQWLIGARADHLRPSCETRARRGYPPPEVDAVDRARRASPPPARHRRL